MKGFAHFFSRVIKKIPAGLIIIPLFLGALIHTFCPSILEIGSFTTAVFSNAGAVTIMGLQLVCLGSRLSFREIRTVAKRGGILLLSKLAAGFAVALIIGKLFGCSDILGISLLAMICVVSNTNGSIYLSLVSMYGDDKDAVAVPIIIMNNGPLFPILILGSAGLASFSWISILGALLPIVIGMIVGNISKEAKAFLEPGVILLIPFIGFSLGAAIDLRAIWNAGMAGVVLAVISIVVGTGISFLFDYFIGHRPGYAAVAAGAVGANAVAVPAVMGFLDTSLQKYSETATVQIAAAVVITSLLIPVLTKCVALKATGKQGD